MKSLLRQLFKRKETGWAPSQTDRDRRTRSLGVFARGQVDLDQVPRAAGRSIPEDRTPVGEVQRGRQQLFLPNARGGNISMHGWTAAAVALLERGIVENRTLRAI